MLKRAKDKVEVSKRRLAWKYGVSLGTVCSILKRNNLFTSQHKRAPKYTDKQLEKVPVCCRSLRVHHFKKDNFIILDDEKYFTFACNTLSGNDHFYTDNINETPNIVKFASKAKFEPKVLCRAVQIAQRHFFVNPIFTTFQMQITSKSHFRYLIDSLSNQMVRITWRFVCKKRHSIHLKWVPKLIEQVLKSGKYLPTFRYCTQKWHRCKHFVGNNTTTV